MKFLTAILGLASFALGAPAPSPEPGLNVDVKLDLGLGGTGQASPLDVKLEMQGNSEVKIVVTNNAERSLKLLKVGTLLDSIPVEKVAVSSKGKLAMVSTTDLHTNQETNRWRNALPWHQAPYA
jgi:hypothetical protein